MTVNPANGITSKAIDKNELAKTQKQENTTDFNVFDETVDSQNNDSWFSFSTTQVDEENGLESSKAKDTKLNGKIDTQVRQGKTGDCWLLAGVLSLNGTDKGKQILKDAITLNNDGSATVNFKGYGKSYKISAEEINNYDAELTGRYTYSRGDNDMLVLEMATEKLREDISNGELKSGDRSYYRLAKTSDGINGGFEKEILYYLTGIQPEVVTSNFGFTDLAPQKALETLESVNENTTLNFGLYGRDHTVTLTNGETFSYSGGSHAFAVTNVDKDNKTVTFVNPWDSQKEYTASWEEFSKIGMIDLTVTDLSKIS